MIQRIWNLQAKKEVVEVDCVVLSGKYVCMDSKNIYWRRNRVFKSFRYASRGENNQRAKFRVRVEKKAGKYATQKTL